MLSYAVRKQKYNCPGQLAAKRRINCAFIILTIEISEFNSIDIFLNDCCTHPFDFCKSSTLPKPIGISVGNYRIRSLHPDAF